MDRCMILNLLFLLPPAAATSPELICELSDCSIPGAKPAHPDCTLDHFARMNLMPVVAVASSSSPATSHPASQGSLLDVTASISDPNCVSMMSQLTTQNDPTKERKWQIGPLCHTKQITLYELHLEVIRDPADSSLKCFKFFFNYTDQCLVMRNDRLRIRVSGRGMEVENFNRDGDIVARMEFVDRNRTLDLDKENCYCGEFDRLAKRYVLCNDESENSTMKRIAYGIAIGFVLTILVVGALYSVLLKD